MEKRKLSTEQVLKDINGANKLKPFVVYEIMADYENGAIIQKFLSIMEEKKVSYRKLAKITGMRKSRIAKLLSEKKGLTLQDIVVISMALGYGFKINLDK